MDIDEKLKQEQLEYYKREKELREEAEQRHAEIVEGNKNMVKAICIVFIAIFLLVFGSMAIGFVKMLISDYLLYQALKLN